MPARWLMPVLVLLFAACSPASQPAPPPTLTVTATAGTTPSVLPAVTQATLAPTANPTALQPLPPRLPSPTPGPLPGCDQRLPADDDLLTLITRSFGISPAYAPPDLVDLKAEFPGLVLSESPVFFRRVGLEDLRAMLAAMQAQDLRPQIVSAYRSYQAQQDVFNRTDALVAGAEYLSAPPGHSEHQLGTALDFTTPELYSSPNGTNPVLSMDFYATPEGAWLLAHAQEYGFTLSYPLGVHTITGYSYEPWHYRYVGPEIAGYLHDQEIVLGSYLIESHSQLPCVP